MAELAFERYIGIDYSGAETPDAPLSGLRVFMGGRQEEPGEVTSPSGTRRHWTRRELAEWLVATLHDPMPTIVGIDHAFSFPVAYFERYRLAGDWSAFLDDFHRHWPTDEDNTYVDFVRDGVAGRAELRQGDTRWRRRTEVLTRAKSVFHFDVPGQVAKSTFAGLPWLRFLRQRVEPRPVFWPFDGWEVPEGRSAVVEVYPRLWNAGPRPDGWTDDQFDAYVVASWLQQADGDGQLAAALRGPADPDTRRVAETEGWILGVVEETAIPRRARRSRKPSGAGTGLARTGDVPEICRFDGIVIGMFYEEHGRPHFHARFGEFKVSVEIDTAVVRGQFPGFALRKVLDWLELHRPELRENWEMARTGQPLRRIDPLHY